MKAVRSCLILGVLKSEPTRFTVGMNEGCKIMQRVVDKCKVFGWSNWRVELLFTESGRMLSGKGAGLMGRPGAWF